eukprot:TRINITY_DN66350_c7_g4_i1.p1 TRINITY_DN66350_c7_g4~~TRINITY_DN66350_c7_g4_i1.p1  ORF type:complete len:556 (+),score=323.48 TRINITY_DN66350_c7_g4_i1:34-1668(+)
MMKLRVMLALLCCGAVAAAPAAPGTLAPLTVTTENGQIKGQYHNNVREFLGVPFAKPPVGPLRWKAPEPAENWSGVRDATTYGDACMQASNPMYGSQSEDCLYLNVFTSNQTHDKPVPVMMFIYGGSFVEGSNALFVYRGDSFVEQARRNNDGVVVVTVNYRLGVIGFLAGDALDAESGTSGNYGILDQQRAMQWIKNNIAAFGGDPNDVLIFGESAGGMSTCLHMVAPGSADLFDRAIVESGPCLQGTHGPSRDGYNKTRVAQMGAVVASKVNCTQSDPAQQLACLRQVDPKVLVKAQDFGSASLQTGWWPVVDGKVIPLDPLVAFAQGKQHNKPLLIGTNTNEGREFSPQKLNTTGMLQYLHEVFTSEDGALAQKVFDQYAPSKYNDSTWWALSAVVTDFFFVCPTRRMLNYHKKAFPDTAVYQYHFDHLLSFVKCPGFTCKYAAMGVFHASELFFVFDNDPYIFDGGFDAKEQSLARAITGYWSAFGVNAKPTHQGDGAIEWPEYGSVTTGNYIILDDTMSTGTMYKQKACDFWDSITPIN